MKIEDENQTLATITFQNYFRMYKKLAGMTGTAETEAEEFDKIYKLDVTSSRPTGELRRVEEPDLDLPHRAREVRRDRRRDPREAAAGPAVLVGTVSIEKSERLSAMLKRRGIKHVVLNAKYHEQEAEIVAQAGRKGAVTIATNMAGRGTDIMLGGNAEYMARQQALAEEVAEKLPSGEAQFVDDERVRLLLPHRQLLPGAARRLGAHLRLLPAPDATPSTTRSCSSAACTSSAPSGTRRGASTTSCAAAPAGRAIRARPASISRSKTT